MKLILHIGWGKSGTTWLQSQIFNQQKVFRNFNKYRLHQLIDPSWGNYDSKKAKEVVTDFVVDSGKSGLTTCISSEGIISSINHSPAVHETTIKRINEIYDGEIKLILFCRKHEDIVSSLYIAHLESYSNLTFEAFLKQYQYQIKYSYAYSDRVRFCQNIFGKENVFTGALEQLNTSPQLLKDNLQKFTGVKLDKFNPTIRPNSKLSYVAYNKTRWMTPSYISSMNNFYQRFIRTHSQEPSDFIINKYRNYISKRIPLEEELKFRKQLKKEIANNFGDFFLKDKECLSDIVDFDVPRDWA